MSPDLAGLVVALLAHAAQLAAQLAEFQSPPFEPGTIRRGPLQFRSGYPEGQRPPRAAPKALARKRKKADRRDRKRVDQRHTHG